MGYTNNQPPAIPSNPTPTDGAENLDYSVTLSWACSDPETHTLKYSVFVGEYGYDMVAIVTNNPNNSYVLSGLKPGTGYAWKIIATDGQAVSEGPTWVFSTKPPNPNLYGGPIVNFPDFAVLAQHWLKACSYPGWCEGADLDWSGQVNYYDLSIYADHWLDTTVP
jgi:hypothetical protein